MSRTFERVSVHVLAAKRDVENRMANHNRKCAVAIIKVQLYIAVSNLNKFWDVRNRIKGMA